MITFISSFLWEPKIHHFTIVITSHDTLMVLNLAVCRRPIIFEPSKRPQLSLSPRWLNEFSVWPVIGRHGFDFRRGTRFVSLSPTLVTYHHFYFILFFSELKIHHLTLSRSKNVILISCWLACAFMQKNWDFLVSDCRLTAPFSFSGAYFRRKPSNASPIIFDYCWFIKLYTSI